MYNFICFVHLKNEPWTNFISALQHLLTRVYFQLLAEKNSCVSDFGRSTFCLPSSRLGMSKFSHSRPHALPHSACTCIFKWVPSLRIFCFLLLLTLIVVFFSLSFPHIGVSPFFWKWLRGLKRYTQHWLHVRRVALIFSGLSPTTSALETGSFTWLAPTFPMHWALWGETPSRSTAPSVKSYNMILKASIITWCTISTFYWPFKAQLFTIFRLLL